MATFELHFFEIDFVFRFVQAMGHFLWLACLPWCAWRIFRLMKPDCSPALQYAGSLGCLLAMAALAPVAFLLSDAATPSVAASVDTIANVAATRESPSPAAISAAASSAMAVDTSPRAAHSPALPTLPPTQRAARSLYRWAPIMFTAYCLGVMVCLLRFLRGVLVSRRLRRRAKRISEPWLIALASRLSAEIGLNAAPVVMWCSETAIPTVAGVLRPTVLLPLAWATSVPTKQLEHVLLHELTHLRRYDHLWNCVQNIIEAVLFFHPLIWIVSGKTRLNRELLCDEAVVHAGVSPHDYALTLVDVAAQRNVASMAVVGVPATAGRSQLRTRIESLLSGRPARHRWLDAVSLTAVLVMLTLLVVAARNTSEFFELSKINYIKFLGNDSVRYGALLKETDLKKGDSLNLYNVQEARNRIEEFYQSKGFPDTEVVIAEGDKPHDLGVVFLVGEGNQRRVHSVKFVGNKIASDGRLKTQVKTKVGALWYLFRGEIDMGKIDEDVERLTAYYRNLGYFRARVGRKLVFTKSRKWADLTFVIDEGPRYSVRDISFVGNKKFAAEDLKRLINLKSGEFFNQGMMLKDQNTLTDLYGGQGHIFASIKADPRFAEDTPELDVVFQVEEGDMYRVGKITVHVGGEFPHTRRNVVLNRVSLRPGDIVDIRKKRASERRLGVSSLFVADPSKGDPPRIVLSPRAPGADGTQVASGAKPSLRGQSPAVYSDQGDARLIDLNIYVTPAELLKTTAVEGAAKKATAKKDAAARETVAEKLADIQPEELAGIVKDENGKPLEGVLVDVWTWYKGDETVTDADGVFRFRPESDGGRRRVEVRFSKPGYSPEYNFKQPVGVKDLVITLNNKTLLEGVLRAADGAPVAGVTVRGEQGPNHADGVLIGSVPTETTTDANGHYTLYVFPDTYTILVANKAGVARYENIVVAANKRRTLNIDLKPGIRFEANVIDAAAGAPFEGLVLYSWQQPEFRGTSNAQGKIVIEGMLPGVFEFNVGNGKPIHIKEVGVDYYPHGVLGRWWSEQAHHPHERREQTAGQFQRNLDGLSFDLRAGMKPVTIEIERGVELIGHVYDPDGKPVAGATVAPAKTGSGNSLTGDTRYSVKTENDGGYRVVMPAGNDFQYNLMAHDGGYQQWRTWAAGVTAPFASRPGQVITHDISLTRGATVKGKVVGKGDLSKHRVQAVAADMLSNRYYNPTVDVQPDGSFELKFIRPGKQNLQVNFSGTLLTLDLAEGELREGVELKIDASPRFAPALRDGK